MTLEQLKKVLEEHFGPPFLPEGHVRVKFVHRVGAKIRFGDERPAWPGEQCHDCGVTKGEYHKDGCDVERCPRCGGQLISCDCKQEAAPQGESVLQINIGRRDIWITEDGRVTGAGTWCIEPPSSFKDV